MEKVKVVPHPAMEWKSTEHFGAEVNVTLRDGKLLKAFQERAIGRGPEILLPKPLLRAKFLDCWSQALPRAHGEDLMKKVETLESLLDTRILFDYFSAASREKRKKKRRQALKA